MSDRADVSTIGLLHLRQFQSSDPSGIPWNWFPLVNFGEATELVDDGGIEVQREVKDSRGPLLGGLCWPFEPGSDRGMTEWAFAMPVKSLPPDAVAAVSNPYQTGDASFFAGLNGGGSSGGHTTSGIPPGGSAGGQMFRAASSVVKGTGWTLSDRTTDKLGAQTAVGPNGEKFPGGMPGIVLPGTSLSSEERCFIPAGNVLVAPFYNGPGSAGTLVYDLDGQGNIDTGTKAPIQSLMRVYELPGLQSSSQPSPSAPNNQIPVYLSSPSYNNPGSFTNPASPLNVHLATQSRVAAPVKKSSGVFALAIECGPTVDGGQGGGVLSDFAGCMGGGSSSGSGGTQSNSQGQQQGQQSSTPGGGSPSGGAGGGTNTGTGLGPNAAGNSGFGMGNAVPLGAGPLGANASGNSGFGIGAAVPIGAGPLGSNAAGNSGFGLNTSPNTTAGTAQGGSSKGGGGGAAGAGGGGSGGSAGGGAGGGGLQALGAMSWRFNGPLTPGVKGDKHELNTNSKGESFGPAHVDTGALFVMDQRRDGPLDFDRAKWEEPASSGPVWETFLRFDDEFEGWRWETHVPVGGSSTGDPPTTPTTPGNYGGGGSLTLDEGPTPVAISFGRKINYKHVKKITNRTRISNALASNVLAPIPGYNTARQEANQLYHIATVNEFSVPSLLLRPQNFNKGVRDLRNSNQWGSAELAAVLKTSPVVARIEALGAEVGDRWTYTTGPVTKSRYKGGSAAGTVNVLPPELGVEQVLDGTEPSSVSNTQFNFYRAGLAFGKPSRTGSTNGVKHSVANTAAANGSFAYNVDQLAADGSTGTSPLLTAATDASGVNQAGTDTVVTPSRGTGTAAGGKFRVQIGVTGASGSTVHAATSRFEVSHTGFLFKTSDTTTFANFDSSTGGAIGFFGAAPVARQTTFAALTDNSGGTPSTTYPASGATYVQSDLNNFKASVASQLSALRTALVNYGLS